MHILIDGHNLIPKLAGFSLSQMDDETELIDVLQSYCRVHRTRVEVFFDQAPPGFSGSKNYGQVTAHFTPRYTTADAAIIRRILKLKNNAGNYTVVTSDRQILAEARACGVKIIQSEEFAADVQEAFLSADEPNTDDAPGLSEEDVEEWLKIFNTNDDHEAKNS